MATGIVCLDCGHKHQGNRLAGICIGCPCPVVFEDCGVCDGSGNYPVEPSDGYLGPCPECAGAGRLLVGEGE